MRFDTKIAILLRAAYTAEMFTTGHDDANRAAVAAVPRAGLDLVGIAVHGPATPSTRC